MEKPNLLEPIGPDVMKRWCEYLNSFVTHPFQRGETSVEKPNSLEPIYLDVAKCRSTPNFLEPILRRRGGTSVEKPNLLEPIGPDVTKRWCEYLNSFVTHPF